MSLYEEVVPIFRSEAEIELASCEPTRIIYALLGLAYYHSDWRWVQNLCLDYIQNNQDKYVRRVAITCLSHLARIHRDLDKKRVVPLLETLRHDPDPEVRGVTADVLDDLKIFLKHKSVSILHWRRVAQYREPPTLYRKKFECLLVYVRGFQGKPL